MELPLVGGDPGASAHPPILGHLPGPPAGRLLHVLDRLRPALDDLGGLPGHPERTLGFQRPFHDLPRREAGVRLPRADLAVGDVGEHRRPLVGSGGEERPRRPAVGRH